MITRFLGLNVCDHRCVVHEVYHDCYLPVEPVDVECAALIIICQLDFNVQPF